MNKFKNRQDTGKQLAQSVKTRGAHKIIANYSLSGQIVPDNISLY